MRKQVIRRHDAYVRDQNMCAEHRELFDGTPGAPFAPPPSPSSVSGAS